MKEPEKVIDSRMTSSIDEKFYEIAGEEIATKNVNKGLWTRAYSLAMGEEAKTKAIYIKLRVEQLCKEYADLRENEKQNALSENERIRRLFDEVGEVSFEDTDHISRDLFVSSKQSLSQPVSVNKAAIVTGMLEFQIIDLIKRGILKGVYDSQDWYFDLACIPNARTIYPEDKELDERAFFYMDGEHQAGPITGKNLRSLHKNRKINDSTKVYVGSDKGWLTFKELFSK